MTRQVADWITRSGARCAELGDAELGSFLARHAEHEAGHEQLHLDDLRRLIARDTAAAGYHRFTERELLGECAENGGVKWYIELHERNIAGHAPWKQIAVESEIELLSVTQGPLLISRIVSVLGFGVLDCLSFVKEHAVLDIGHSYAHLRTLDRFLGAHPDRAKDLAKGGIEALEAYARHVEIAFDAARRDRRGIA